MPRLLEKHRNHGSMHKNFLMVLYGVLCFFSCVEEPQDTILENPKEGTQIDSLLNLVLKDDEHSGLNRLKTLDKIQETLSALEATSRYNYFKSTASALYKNKSYDEYLWLNDKMFKNGLRYKDTLLLYQAEKNYASYHYYVTKKMDSAYSRYYRTSSYAEALDSLRYAGFAYLSMGIIQKNVRDYSGSEISTIKALEYLKLFDEDRYIASCYNNLGLISRQVNQEERAIDYFKKAIFYRDKVPGNNYIQAGSYNNMGITYAKSQNYTEAIRYYSLGLGIDSLFTKSPETYARLLHNKARAQFLMGDVSQLPSAFHLAYRLRDSLGDRLGKVTSSLHLGEYYTSIKDTARARKYFNTALKDAKITKYTNGYLQALQQLSLISDPAQAIALMQEHIDMSDSLLVQERSLQDHFVRTRYETDQLQEQAGMLEMKAELATKKSRFAVYLLISSFIVFLLWYIMRLRREKEKERKYQESQAKASEEMYTLMLSQNTKVQEAKAQEKKRISQELHDGVLGRLFGLRLSLDMLNAKEGEKAIAKRENYLEELKEVGQEIRKISHDLQDNDFLEDTSYKEVVEVYLAEQCSILDCAYSLYCDPHFSWNEISMTTKVHLYRILQESIMNIGKHAKAKNIAVSYRKFENFNELAISDDGVGVSERKRKKGIGMANMQTRAMAISGKFSVESQPDEGTTIKIQF